MIVLMIFILLFSGMFSVKAVNNGNNKPIHGKVVKIESGGNKNSQRFSNVDVKIISGKLKGRTITVQNFVGGKIKDENSSTQSFVKVGDEVLINVDKYDKNGNVQKAYIYEIVRYKYLYKLGIFFVLLLIIIGGKRNQISYNLGYNWIYGVKSFNTSCNTGIQSGNCFFCYMYDCNCSEPRHHRWKE